MWYGGTARATGIYCFTLCRTNQITHDVMAFEEIHMSSTEFPAEKRRGGTRAALANPGARAGAAPVTAYPLCAQGAPQVGHTPRAITAVLRAPGGAHLGLHQGRRAPQVGLTQ